jgi:predicted ATPase
LRRNPLFAHLFSKNEQKDALALTKVLTSHESAMTLDSPRGLLLYGEVGTGKKNFTSFHFWVLFFLSSNISHEARSESPNFLTR